MADERPAKPEFGEYAPEGWEWNPEEADAPTAPGADAAPPAGSVPRQGSGQIPGVPHNLGAPARPGSAPAAPSSSGAQGAPPRPEAPAAPGGPRPAEPAPYRAEAPALAGSAAFGAPRPKLADRVITIILLVVGAFGALNLAASANGMRASFDLMATALEVDGFSAPASLGTLGTIGAIAIFAIYALNVVYSIQRLRHARLAFWVPLAAFVAAFIVFTVILFIAMGQAPDLMQAMSAPDAPSKVLDYMFAQAGSTP